MPTYTLNRDSDGKWFIEDFTYENLGSILMYPKNGTLAECLKLIRNKEKYRDED